MACQVQDTPQAALPHEPAAEVAQPPRRGAGVGCLRHYPGQLPEAFDKVLTAPSDPVIAEIVLFHWVNGASVT